MLEAVAYPLLLPAVLFMILVWLGERDSRNRERKRDVSEEATSWHEEMLESDEVYLEIDRRRVANEEDQIPDVPRTTIDDEFVLEWEREHSKRFPRTELH